MNSYDDLQRFKDKTHTGSIEFKDMSAEKQGLGVGSSLIFSQLSQEGDGDEQNSPFRGAAHTSVTAPDAVKPGTFDVPPGTSSAAAQANSLPPVTWTTEVIKTTPQPVDEAAPSLLKEMAMMPKVISVKVPANSTSSVVPAKPAAPPQGNALLPNSTKAVEPLENAAPIMAALAATPPGNTVLDIPEAVPETQVIQQPARRPEPVSTPPSSDGKINFAQLFAPSSAGNAPRSAVKEMPLKPLLERIASCR
ncbi:cellulose biosynthesis protein BcsO [Mangrovibacter yixingensis]|uniref:cellulose biosynthesis protein BcsO n=1 Tax=Mangrovibacter yixingensis TaxID=1529639 RepID=UPI001CFC6EB2|nr:cellulose biosynthesis protein BcsO [Mangrovibacter yixingensis]